MNFRFAMPILYDTYLLCLLGLVWLPISPAQANTIGIIGWGVAGPIVFLLLANLFTRIKPESGPSLAAKQWVHADG